jgi:hypothetical protein
VLWIVLGSLAAGFLLLFVAGSVAVSLWLAHSFARQKAEAQDQAITETDRGTELAGWGLAIDPDKDCKFTPGPESLTIDVAAAWHDLALGFPVPRINAPPPKKPYRRPATRMSVDLLSRSKPRKGAAELFIG